MIMKKYFINFVLILFTAVAGYAQTKQVKGVVADTTGVTIPGAVIKLTSPLDTLAVVTDINGVFTFGAVKAKQFSITFQSIGYQGLKRTYNVAEDAPSLNIGTIKLKTESKMLNTINITDVNAVKIKEDTTVYDAKAYPVRANASTEDVLKKLPGVDVDANGNVTHQGKAVNKVRINGKDFFGGDVQTATKNLPADVIESIQMIDDYGDQANLTGLKTGEPNKVMNIVIRQDKNYGYSLSATGGDGRDAVPAPATNANRYFGSLNTFKFKGDQQIALLGSINNTNLNTFSFGGGGGGGFGGGGGGGRGNAGRGGGGMGGTPTPVNGITDAKSLGLNFRDQWGKYLSVYGSYSFADNKTNTISSTTQTNGTNGDPLINNQNSNETDGTINHRVTWNMEYKPDTLNYLKVTPSFSYGSTTTNSIDANSLHGNGSTGLAYTTTTNANSHSPNYGLNVLYNHRFNGHGRNFSIFANGSSTTSDGFSNPFNLYTVGHPTAYVPANQLINTHSRTTSISSTFSYIEPLSKVSFLEGNYTISHTQTDNDKNVDTVTVGGGQNYYAKLSNTYNSTFNTNRFGINYRLIEPQYNLTLGAAVQPSVLDGFAPAISIYPSVTTHLSTFNFIPTARFVYNFSKSEALNFNYSGSNSQPSYAQLNPRPDSSNATYFVVGNPNLQPEFNNSFRLSFNKFSFGTGNILLANLSFVQTNNKVITNKITVGNVQTIKYLNTDGYYTANGFFTFAKPWNKRMYTLIINGNVNYTNDIGYLNNVQNIAKGLTYTPGLRFRLDIQNVIDAQASASYAVNKTNNSLASVGNTDFQATTLGLNGKNYFFTDWTLSYDYSKVIYQGYSGATSNPNILNTYLERRFLKNNVATIRAAVYDVFNQNTGVTNSQSGGTTTQSLVNRLGRYYLVSLTIRLQKFAGKAPQQDFGPGGGRRRDGEGGGHGPGGGGSGGGMGGPGGM